MVISPDLFHLGGQMNTLWFWFPDLTKKC